MKDVFWQRRLENEKQQDPSHKNALCHTSITERERERVRVHARVCVCVCVCV